MSIDLQDWLEWNGERSSDHGIVVLQQPTIATAQERIEFVDIPGRNGSLAVSQGDNVFNDITLSAKCLLEQPYLLQNDNSLYESRIIDICNWLRGNGKIVFGHRPDGYYKGRIANQISFDRAVRGNPHRVFNLEFRCKPFFYLESGDRAITIANNNEPGVGTNLFDPTSPENVDGSYINENGSIGTGSGYSGLSHYISVTAGKTYYINTGTTQSTRRFVAFYDANGQLIEADQRHNAQADPWVTIPSDASKIRFTYWIASKSTTVKVVEAEDTGSTKTLHNPGTLPAEPLYKVYGSGNGVGVISINEKEMRITNFENLDYLYIDTEAKIAYKDNTLLNGRVGGDMVDIPTGDSVLTLAGSITRIELTPRWRSIG